MTTSTDRESKDSHSQISRRKHSLSEQGNEFHAQAHDERLLNIDTWFRFVGTTNDSTRVLSQSEACMAFVMSKLTVFGERRARSTNTSVEHIYLTRIDFNEVLCRAADAYVPEPTAPLHEKLLRLLSLKSESVTSVYSSL